MYLINYSSLDEVHVVKMPYIPLLSQETPSHFFTKYSTEKKHRQTHICNEILCSFAKGREEFVSFYIEPGEVLSGYANGREDFVRITYTGFGLFVRGSGA